MKCYKQMLLGIVIGAFLVCLLGVGAIDKTYFTHNPIFEDDYGIYFGSDSDVTLEYDGTNFELFAAAIDTPFAIGGTTYGFDITYYFEDAGTIAVDFDGDGVTFSDGMALNIGGEPSTDGVLSWDNTNAEVDLTTATGSIHFTLGAVPDAQYGLEVGSTIAGTTRSEGSAAYFHTTLSGAWDGPTYNLGSWLDITAGTPTGSLAAAIECGIYAPTTPTLSAVTCVGLGITTVIHSGAAPNRHYMMRFNTQQGGDTPDAWFSAVNPQSIAYSSNATHQSASNAKVGAIKVQIGEVGYAYLYVYSDAGS